MTPRIRSLGAALAFGVVLLGATVQETFAALANYTFDVSNGGSGAPTSGNFGTATINVTSSTSATITYTSTTCEFVGVGFNFTSSGSGSTITSVTGLPTGWSSQTNTQMDGFGTFTYEFEGNGASTAQSTVTLTITGTNLTLSEFQTLSQSPAPNGAVVLGAHMFCPTLAPQGSNTFYAGAHPTTAVPEPSTLALAGLGSIGFLAFGLRRRLKK